MIIEIIIILGCLIDLSLTYNYLTIYKKKFPKKDFIIIESNPLIRAAIRQYGLGDGIAISGFVILVMLIMILAFINTNFKFFVAGVYYMMITFHLTNLLALRRMKVVRR